MSRERLLRGERSGRERDAREPFDWRDLAEQYGLSARDAMHLWDEAGLRAAGSLDPRGEQESVFVDLLQEVSGSRHAPAPGKVTLTAARDAGQTYGRRRSSRQAAAPGKVALTSYLSAAADREAGTDQARALVKPDAGAHDPAILIDRARRRAERIDVPMRREMEEELGVSFGHVIALAGSAAEEALAALDAEGAAIDDVVLFGNRHPDRDLVRHELTHVAQAGSRRAPERFAPGSLTLSAPDSAAELAAAAGLGHTAAPANVVHRAPPRGKPGAAAEPVIEGKSGKEGPLGEWAGPGKTGRVVRTRSVESWVDPATGDTVDIQTSWTLAEHAQVELKTDAVVQAERTIRVQLGRGPSVLIKSRGRSWFNADGLPNDPGAAVHVPSASAQHDGLIYVTDDSGTHLIDSMPHQHARGASLAGPFAAEPMLAYDVAPQERVRHVEHFVSKTLPQLERNLAELAEANQEAGRAIEMLKAYIQAKLNYESPPDDALSRARWAIGLLRSVGGRLTGYEGKDTTRYVDALIVKLEKLTADAKKATPADKKLLDHAADLGKAVLSAGQNIALAAREIALMGRDWVLYRADTILDALGVDVDWSPASAVGQALAAGKSAGEIFEAMIEGMVAEWEKAIEHASNGDYSLVMNLSAELAIDVVIDIATAGAATPALAAKRGARAAAKGARALKLTEAGARQMANRARDLARRAKKAAETASAEGRKALLDLQDTAQGLIDGLRDAVKVTDTGTGVTHLALDAGAIPQAIQRARTARALKGAESAVKTLRGTARGQGRDVVRRLEKLSDRDGMASAVRSVADRLAAGDGAARYVAALDDALSSWARKLEDDVLAAVLRRSAAAVDPAELLGHVDWIMGRKGIKLEARQLLVRKAALSDAMDLAWLRELTDLPDDMLEFMALDPNTSWKTFMKVSTEPSSYFPDSMKRLLGRRDYAQAAARLRGVAGELIFAVDDVELPAGLKIVARQVDSRGARIDFGLADAAGKPARLEVKAWNQRRWQMEIARADKQTQPTGALGNMLKQLRAAKTTGEPVYLAVSDAIGDRLDGLRRLLAKHRLGDVRVFTFPESKLKEAAARLRAGLGLAAGVALVTADEIAEVDDDE